MLARDGLRRNDSIAKLGLKVGIVQSLSYTWSKELMKVRKRSFQLLRMASNGALFASLLGLSACGEPIFRDIPDDAAINVQVGEVGYRVPFHFYPDSREQNRFELYQSLLAGDGARGNPILTKHVVFRPNGKGSSPIVGISDFRKTLDADELKMRPITASEVQGIELSNVEETVAPSSDSPGRYQVGMAINFIDGDTQQIVFTCGGHFGWIEKTSSLKLINCSSRFQTAGKNSVVIRVQPGEEPDLIKQEMQLVLETISAIQGGR